MHFLPTRLPIIVLHRVEEELPVSEIMVGVKSLCADKRVLPSYSRDLYGPKNKMFSMNYKVGYVDWVSLFPDRNMWKASLKMLISLKLCARQVSAKLIEQQFPVHFRLSLILNVAAK